MNCVLMNTYKGGGKNLQAPHTTPCLFSCQIFIVTPALQRVKVFHFLLSCPSVCLRLIPVIHRRLLLAVLSLLLSSVCQDPSAARSQQGTDEQT